MATVKELTTMCKAGHITEAYELALSDFSSNSTNIWFQRGMGWTLYYFIKADVEEKKTIDMFAKLDEFSKLNLLTMQADSLVFNNILWKLAEFVKVLPKENVECLDYIFSFVKGYTFTPFNGYSYFLKVCLHFDSWDKLVQFFEWWNLDNLLPEDFKEFKTDSGKKIMSLAEQVYIAYSKALLRLNDKQKIQEFVPKLEKLMESHPEMMYPGYFCGKLMLALETDKNEALKIVMPFIRKKKNEFWAWQLVSDIYQFDQQMQLACLLRAIHCKAKEEFLGKVRMKLVALYLSIGDYPRAKFHLDNLVRCTMQHGWHLSFDVQCWIRQPWVQKVAADETDKIDYRLLTDKLLRFGSTESWAVVVYIDWQSKRTWMVYGEKKRMSVKNSTIPIKLKEGDIFKLFWIQAGVEKIDIVGAEKIQTNSKFECSYIKTATGKVEKKVDKLFAFIKDDHGKMLYVSPALVKKNNLQGGEMVEAKVVFEYNKKKEVWNWVCLSLKIKK